MSKRNHESFTQAFMDYSKAVGAPDKFLLWSAISGIAGCLERRTWITYNNIQVIYPNLFVMLIADSGIANKSTATRPIMDLLYNVETLNFMSAQMTAAALIAQLQRAGDSKEFELKGIKYKNSSVFSYSSEAKVTLGDNKAFSGIQELLTDFYDCGDPSTWSDRKGWTKHLVSTGEQVVFNPCLNLLYCSTPVWLLEALGKSGIEGGFASRCIFIHQKERHKANQEWLDEEDQVVNKEISDMRSSLIHDLKIIASMRGEFKPVKGFKDVYNRFLKERNDKLDRADNPQMQPYYARRMWHLLKLTQILAANESNEMIVKPEHLERANMLLTSVEPDMYSAFGVKGENQSASAMSKVWDKVRHKQVIEKSDLVKSGWSRLSMKQIDEMLQLLHTMKKIAPQYGGGKITYTVIDHSEL